MCDHFAKIWDHTNRPRRELVRNYGGSGALSDKDLPRFVRIDKWLKIEPPRHPVIHCACGVGDKWLCWHRTTAKELLGGARAGRGWIPLPPSE